MSERELKQGHDPSPTRDQPAASGFAGALLAAALLASSFGLATIEDEPANDQGLSAPLEGPASESPAAPEPPLMRLTVAPEADGSEYDRAAFKHWIDADGNGCDTRQEVLISESRIEPSRVPGIRCRVAGGEWFSIYDGVVISDSPQLDIDHMVPLKEAWESTAAMWAPEQREAYANDLDEPLALLAVTASTNRSKADRDPAEWKPPDETSWCAYARAWLEVKIKWSLTADGDEVAALSEMLTRC